MGCRISRHDHAPVLDLSDPHDLRTRFVTMQRQDLQQALSELESGAKRSHWIWYIFPTGPWIVNGAVHGSRDNVYYSLKSDDTVRAYLTFPTDRGVNLRDNYLKATAAVIHQLEEKGITGFALLGRDVSKVRNSLLLFHRVSEAPAFDSPEGSKPFDSEVAAASARALAAVGT